MKFTDGFWQVRPGVDAQYGQEAYDLWTEGARVKATVPTAVIRGRGDTLNRPVLTVTLRSPLPGVIGVSVEHHRGRPEELTFELPGEEQDHGEASITESGARLTSGGITAVISEGAPWHLQFIDTATGRVLTSSGSKSMGYIRLDEDAQVDRGPVGNARERSSRFTAETYLHEQLSLGVGELVYGLGERFGPVVKNGQVVDIWNADGGTSSEQAYKNVPFYMTNRGYGVLVNHPGHVSFEVASEAVERVQFSVPGEKLEYFVFNGGTPVEVLERYTALTGRPPEVPDWSYGLWLSTSFTTDYDERTVNELIDGMETREIPLSVFHFDCFWMREFNWCDFQWDPRTFPDPEGMLRRLHDRSLKICVWINPYIAQRSPLFDEGMEKEYLVRRPDGSVWQWDLWQAGMALVDFTNPAAAEWYKTQLRRLVDQGVDAFKTDFGERIPVEVEYFDGSSPERMHNYYTHLFNTAVFEVLEETRGRGEAVLFARSATAGGHRMPVHWGGDSTSTFESMAETLRGGLSLAMSGFSHWSHDIGGFEGTAAPAVFKRWVAFGLLSSHSRLHGSESYRVPWLFDEAAGIEEDHPHSAVSVLRRFATLKEALTPYLARAGREAAQRGTPVLRPMPLAFPHDPAVEHLDRQYMLGPDLLVAPVMNEAGEVSFYLPQGQWTHLLDGRTVQGGSWMTEQYDVTSLPLYLRAASSIPIRAASEETTRNVIASEVPVEIEQ